MFYHPVGPSPMEPRTLRPEFTTPQSHVHPSPTRSKEARQLQSGKWEVGSDFQSAMIKSAPTMVTKLDKEATYEIFKAWQSSVEDWVFSHTSLLPADLGPISVRSVARMTLKQELYTALDNAGAMGSRTNEGV